MRFLYNSQKDKLIESEGNRCFGLKNRKILLQQVRQIERKKLLNKNEINSDEILILRLKRQKDRKIEREGNRCF